MQVPSNFSAVVAPMAACSAGKRLVKLRLRDDEVRQTNYQSQPSAVSYCTELRLHTPVSWSWSRDHFWAVLVLKNGLAYITARSSSHPLMAEDHFLCVLLLAFTSVTIVVAARLLLNLFRSVSRDASTVFR